MTGDTDAVEARLRRLDTADCAALVADLWAERGFDTTVSGGVVEATRDDARERIAVVGRGIRAPPSPDGDVDTVVSVDGHPDWVPEEARTLDAADLREMLWYAIDRERTAAICERHLGAPPGQIRPPLRYRVRRGVQTPEARLAVVVVVAALAVAAVGAVATLALDTGETGADIVPADTERRALPDSGFREESAAIRSPDGTPPGVNDGGIADLTALARAHERAVGNGSYTLWLDLYRPRDRAAGGPRIQRDMDFAVDGEQYVLETTVENESGSRQSVAAVFHEGDEWYLANRDAEPTEYRRVTTGPPTVAPEPAELRRTLVSRYLSAETTTVARIERDGQSLFRINGTGGPTASGFDDVRNYSVTAVVTPEGLVRDLTVEATVASGDGGYEVRFEATYDRFGETTVTPPDWYREEFGGSDPMARWAGDTRESVAASESRAGAYTGRRSS
ncbi:MAG: hypothetical protein ABEH56_05520 [Salinirussus sp.]